MEVASVLSNSARYSSRFTENFDKLLILAVFTIIPVVNLLVLGYLVRVIRESPMSSSLPPLNNWARMLVDGITLLVISLCYLAAGAVITLVLFYLGSPQLALFGMIVVFMGYFLLPIALVHAVRTGNPSSAFDIGKITTRVRTIGAIDYFLLVLAIFLFPLIIMGVLALIPFLGWFIAFLIAPVMGTFIARASALGYGL
jgi:hypothetical protein